MHIGAATLDDSGSAAASEGRQAVLELGNGATHVSAETAQQVAMVPFWMIHPDQAEPLARELRARGHRVVQRESLRFH